MLTDNVILFVAHAQLLRIIIFLTKCEKISARVVKLKCTFKNE